MTEQQWATLVAVIRGETVRPIPTGFIVDSPWLPNWAGRTILDYYTSDEAFLQDNLKAIEAFPRAILLPGFWSEYGMCTEPSAFGGQLMWGQDDFPSAGKVLRSIDDVEALERPDPRKHGLLPFVINRLKHLQPRIEAAGHQIRFAVARGPFNIASFLLGTTEFMLALKTAPRQVHRLLAIITDFLVDWIDWQRECFPSIDGLLVLDDIIGFVGGQDFEEFAQPCLARIFSADVTVKLLPQRRAVQGVRSVPRGRRRQRAELRRPAHAQPDAGVDGRPHHAARQRPAPRCAGGRHAGGRGAGHDRDARVRRGHLAPDRLVWRRHAAGRADAQHRGADAGGGRVRSRARRRPVGQASRLSGVR